MTESGEAVRGESRPGENLPRSQPAAFLGNSVAVASWTVVSRITGLGKLMMIAAVLGPTYLGNTYQAGNSIPNLVYYGLLAGSLFPSLLVPPLMRHVDVSDRRATERVAGGFLGVALIALTAVTAIAVLAGPWLLRLLSLTVEDDFISAAQRRVGLPLLVMLMPQVVLYGIAGTGGAVMNAHGRFALAAAAPTLENIGIIATLAATAMLFGTGTALGDIGTPQLLVLGLGTTAAVGLHAAAQWWGARRVGVSLIPRAGWRDAEVRTVVRRSAASLAHASLAALQFFVAIMVANRLAGGVVAFQLAMNFFWLVPALAATPLAVALLPQLARLQHEGERQLFRDELVRAVGLTLFLTVPAALAYIALAFPLARAISFGEMATERGVTLAAASLGALGLGVLANSFLVVATHASYAQHDARSPLISMIIRAVVSLGGMLVALTLEGAAVLIALGLSISIGDIAGSWHLANRLRARLPRTGESVRPTLLRTLLASALILVPVYAILALLSRWTESEVSELIAMLFAAGLGALGYFALQKAWKSPELDSLVAAFGRATPWRTPGIQTPLS